MKYLCKTILNDVSVMAKFTKSKKLRILLIFLLYPLYSSARVMLPVGSWASNPYAYEFMNGPGGRIINFHISALSPSCVRQGWYPYPAKCFSSNSLSQEFAYAESWAAAWLRYYHASYNPSEYVIHYLWLYGVNPQGKTGYTLFARIRSEGGLLTNKNLGDRDKCDISEGNPINIGNGNKFLVQKDYMATTKMPLTFVRYYNSRGSSGYPWTKWSATYFQKIELFVPGAYPGVPSSGYNHTVVVKRPNGKIYHFQLINGIWQGESDVVGRLEETAVGWLYSTEDDTAEEYDNQGKLISITNRSGLTHTLTYSDSLLATVEDSFGHTLNFTYYANGLIKNFIDPAGNQYTYTYDANFNLKSVQHPDGAILNYLYEKTDFVNALTGIVDERGIRFATYDYDMYERGILTEHYEGVQRIQVSYNSDDTSTVTDSMNANRSYEFEVSFGSIRTGQISSSSCAACAMSSNISYDSNGFVASRTDWNGNVTDYVHDSRGLEISRVEGSGTNAERTITTAWHPSFRLPVEIVESGKRTIYEYDNSGNLLVHTETDTTVTPNVSRIVSYTYNNVGQVLTVDGSRTDVNDITTFAYDAQGNRISVTNALNHITQIPDHDPHGNPLKIINPNGIVTEFVYDVRQRLISRTVAAGTSDEAVTNFDYDAAGLLTRVTHPNGSYLRYEYDGAQRLIAIEDNLENRIEYVLDAVGNRTAENVYDSGDVLRKAKSSIYNQLGRLIQNIGANGQIISYAYDDNGNRTNITDGKNNVTSQSFDPLNRLVQMIDPYNGPGNPTNYDYDAQGNMANITDPTGVSTIYLYNGFGEIIQETSPNTGMTTYSYDGAGNRIEKIDARGVTVSYHYDALNRLILTDYPGDIEDISYVYDQILNNNPGVGRLTQIQDQSGSTAYTYDRRGNVIADSKTVNGGTSPLNVTVQYAYDDADNLTQIAYPSGRTVTYTRNTLGQVSEVETAYSSQTQSLATSIQYQPFGSITGFTYGNGLTHGRDYDLDYRIASLTDSSVQDRDYDYDLNDNVSDIFDVISSGNDQTFDYDDLNRLIDADGNYGVYDYSYDGIGNRLTETLDTATTNYGYIANTHRLQSVDSETRSYDAAGNTVGIDGDSFDYNHQNRLSQATVGTVATDYAYNALGQRTLKTDGSQTVLYVYDLSGLLVAEYDGVGSLQREYVYLNGEPLALIDATPGIYYYHNDHLGTPQLLTNQSQTVVWQASYTPFGEANVTTSTIENNLRFPGQYFDQETGLHYNYFRYYDPTTGRYITSDPIGVLRDYSDPQLQVSIKVGALERTDFAGEELNHLYGYVGQNPVYWIDPFGLAKGGKQNIRDTGMSAMTDAEVEAMANDPNATKEDRRKAQKEQKARKQRNIRKRGKAGNFILKCFKFIAPGLVTIMTTPSPELACPGSPNDNPVCDEL